MIRIIIGITMLVAFGLVVTLLYPTDVLSAKVVDHQTQKNQSETSALQTGTPL